MKNKQNINLFLILFMSCMKLYGLENENSEMINSTELAVEFPPHANEKYIYDFVIEPIPNSLNDLLKLPNDQIIFYSLNDLLKLPNGQIIFSDKITKHYFNNGITRKKVTLNANNAIQTMITETWTSRNPSHMTITNAVAAISATPMILALILTMTLSPIQILTISLFDKR